MKIAIIGAGNMGGAIARGLSKGSAMEKNDLIVSDPSDEILNALKSDCLTLQIAKDNAAAAAKADWVIVAVKPWLVKTVLEGIAWHEGQVLVSIAAGVTFDQLKAYVGVPEFPIFRVIPNTAISQMESMTLVAGCNVTTEQEQLLLDLFGKMGMAMLVSESQMAAATALTSCGIAYVLKYVQAAMQAGVELGLKPADAQRMVAQSVKGAAALLLNNQTHPAVEIDKVTTPGGITIKGLNELEHAGFSSAIIRAMKVSM